MRERPKCPPPGFSMTAILKFTILFKVQQTPRAMRQSPRPVGGWRQTLIMTQLPDFPVGDPAPGPHPSEEGHSTHRPAGVCRAGGRGRASEPCRAASTCTLWELPHWKDPAPRVWFWRKNLSRWQGSWLPSQYNQHLQPLTWVGAGHLPPAPGACPICWRQRGLMPVAVYPSSTLYS